jgi:hypothetical protein
MMYRGKNHLLAGVCLAATLVGLPSVVHAKTEVTPNLEVSQVLDAQIKGGNDVLTYSSVAAGVDVSVTGPRAQAQVNYRYEHRFGWGKNQQDEDIHSGLARASYAVVPNLLSIDAGALATRTRSDIRGDAPSILTGNSDNITQVYSVYGGPTLSTRAGPVEVNAAYRLAYTAVKDNDFIPAAGQPSLGGYDDSIAHLATVSAGMAPGEALPFGWTVGAAYEREDTGELDQRFESKGVSGNVIVPVTSTVALLGGVGYEKIQASERAPLLDTGGAPVLDGRGRFVTDPASPRLLSYDFDGVYWDVGVGWKPSRRTSIEAHVGRRYGSWSYTGSLSWQTSENSAFQLGVYDQVQTFGQQLSDSLASLPTSFNVQRNPLSQEFGGCTFGGGASGSGAGSCLNPALQSVNGSVFRSRGVTALYSASRGRWNAGVGLGYSQRTYRTPNAPGVVSLNGVKDESWFGEGNVGYAINSDSSVDASVYANLFESGIAGAPKVLSTGATGSYNRNFGRKLSATAAVGLYSYRIEDQPGEINASALLGMRYSF